MKFLLFILLASTAHASQFPKLSDFEREKPVLEVEVFKAIPTPRIKYILETSCYPLPHDTYLCLDQKNHPTIYVSPQEKGKPPRTGKFVTDITDAAQAILKEHGIHP